MSPHIEVPGLEVTDEQRQTVQALIEADEHIQSEKRGMLLTLLRLGKPIAVRTPKPRKKPTKHQLRYGVRRCTGRRDYLTSL